MIDYYKERMGNPAGIPVVQIGINLERNQPSLTDNFVQQAGYEYVANDTSRALARRFQSTGQPIFVIINGVANSPSHRQWEVLLNQNGYGTTQHPITLFRSIVDAVQAPAAAVPPSIERHPESQTVLMGEAASLSVAASGTSPLSFQWQKDGVNLPQATNSNLTLPSVRSDQAGPYRVIVSNAAGSVTSQTAELMVRTPILPPQIAAAPQSRTATVGTRVMLMASAVGTEPLRYQWFLNGQELPGATAATLTIENVQTNQAGEYAVAVSNEAGRVTSTPALLQVHSPPVIQVHPESQTVIAGAPVLLKAVATGTAPVTYQWQKDERDLLGATESQLRIESAQASHAGQYRVLVSNPLGSAASVSATLAVLEPPAILTQPQSQTVRSGASATFTVTAAGTEPLSYQWKFNDAEIPGAITARYTVLSAAPAHAGGYNVIVRNAAGTVASETAILSIETAPVAPPRLGALRMVPGGVEFSVWAEVGLAVQIEVSADLLDWSPLSTVTGTGAARNYLDSRTNGLSSRFYRARILAP